MVSYKIISSKPSQQSRQKVKSSRNRIEKSKAEQSKAEQSKQETKLPPNLEANDKKVHGEVTSWKQDKN